jgi:hypothetical protein
MVYEIPFTTPALGALFCNDTVLVEDIFADGYLELFVLAVEACGVTSPCFEMPRSRRRAVVQG